MCYNGKNRNIYSGLLMPGIQDVLKKRFPHKRNISGGEEYMGYTEALNDIGASYNNNGIDLRPNRSGDNSGFGKVMKETHQQENNPVPPKPEDISVFQTGAAIDMLSVMSQLRVSDEAGFTDELDEAIGFDEIEELDSIADSEEIKYDDDGDDIQETDDFDVFSAINMLPDSDDLSETDLSVFDLIEDVS